MVETVLYLVRHAQTDANVTATFQGNLERDVSESGREQLRYLAERFKDVRIDVLYASPLRRAFDTAVAINQYHNLPIILDEGLVEINGGDFEGVVWSEVQQRFPHEADLWYRAPHEFVAPGDGDCMRDVYDRMKASIETIVAANRGKVIVVVSHGCALRNAMCWLTDTPFDKLRTMDIWENTGVAKIEFHDDGSREVCYIGDSSHLPDELCHYTRNPVYSQNNPITQKFEDTEDEK